MVTGIKKEYCNTDCVCYRQGSCPGLCHRYDKHQKKLLHLAERRMKVYGRDLMKLIY